MSRPPSNPSSPALAGFHHARLPVADLEASVAWYVDVLGFERDFPFRRGEAVIGWALQRNAGSLRLVLMQDPAGAARCSGLALFSFEVPGRDELLALQQRLAGRGAQPGEILPALAGSKLLDVADPDGHLIGFYTVGPRAYTPA